MMNVAFVAVIIPYVQIVLVLQMAILYLTNAAHATVIHQMIAFRIVVEYGEVKFLILIMIQYAITLIYVLEKMIFLIVIVT